MKLGKWATLIFSFFLICGVLNAQERSSEKYYRNAVALHSTIMKNVMNRVAEEYSRPSQLGNPEYRRHLTTLNNLLISQADAWNKMPAHPEYQQFHNTYTNALRKFWRAGKTANKGLKQGNSQRIIEAAQLTREGNTTLQKALTQFR